MTHFQRAARSQLGGDVGGGVGRVRGGRRWGGLSIAGCFRRTLRGHSGRIAARNLSDALSKLPFNWMMDAFELFFFVIYGNFEGLTTFCGEVFSDAVENYECERRFSKRGSNQSFAT